MPGADSNQEALSSYVSPEARAATKHPPRAILAMIAEGLAQMDRRFEELYCQTGRPSIAPERLIQGLLLVVHSIRRGRLLLEQLEYNLLFRWFVGLSVDEPVLGHGAVRTNHNRLLVAHIVRELFETIIELTPKVGLLSDENFSADGRMIMAWASHESLRPKDGIEGIAGDCGRDIARYSLGEHRTNGIHACTTDPEAKVYEKSAGTHSELAYLGHPVSESHSSVIVAAQATEVSGASECRTSLNTLGELSGANRCTIVADKGYVTRTFARKAWNRNITRHAAQNIKLRVGLAFDVCMTRDVGYARRVTACKRIEESVSWAKGISPLRRPKMPGCGKIEFAARLTFFTV